MLKARRKHQKTRKLIEGAAKKAKRLAKQSLKGTVPKKEKVKKEKVKKEKVKVDKAKSTSPELERQDKKSGGSAGKKGGEAGGKKGAS